jgi:hypothetical protein
MEIMRSNALFADAASVSIGYDDNWRHPEIVDTETYTNTDYINDLICLAEWTRVRLSKKVLNWPPNNCRLLKSCGRNSLSVKDINCPLFTPGISHRYPGCSTNSRGKTDYPGKLCATTATLPVPAWVLQARD